MRSRHHSIRHRLLIVLLLLISITWICVGVMVYRDAEHEVEEVYDANLSQTGRMLLGLLKHEAEEGEEDVIGEISMIGQVEHPYEFKIAMRVRYADGSEALRTLGSPPFQDDVPEGFGTYVLDGDTWRLFSLTDITTGIRVQTGHILEVRQELVEYILRRSLSSLIVGLPTFGLFIWWAVGRGLRPLERVARKVGEADPESLLPINDDNVPVEVTPLIDAINRLFTRLRLALEKERRFTEDAAHELRTPLAALKIQAQVARRSESDEQRHNAIGKIVEGVNRVTHLVGQLLTLARADAGDANNIRGNKADLYQVAQEAIVPFAAGAIKRNIELSLDTNPSVFLVAGDEVILGIMIRNLVDNALKYSPDGGYVHVQLAHDGAGVELVVSDNGPGIPDAQMDIVFERFHRGYETTVTGSGLGLSIVKRICDLHDATIHMSRTAKEYGLEVKVHFNQPMVQ